MQSDVSILACAPQNTPRLNSHFMRGLKKEPSHYPTGVIDTSVDIKNVFLSHIGNKSTSSSPTNHFEPHKIPLDSVETLLRSKSYEEPPTNPDSDLNELLQFVSERSCFSDEKPLIETSNSYWLSNPSPPPIKDRDSPRPAKLPAVDQIMKCHPRNSPPFKGTELFPSFEQSPHFLPNTTSGDFTPSSVAGEQPILPIQDSCEFNSLLSCKVSQISSAS